MKSQNQFLLSKEQLKVGVIDPLSFEIDVKQEPNFFTTHQYMQTVKKNLNRTDLDAGHNEYQSKHGFRLFG